MTMIVSLKKGFEVGRVRGELAARGLWVESVEVTTDGRACLVVAPCSAPLAATELLLVEGVESVSEKRSLHPLVDRLGPTLELEARAGGVVTLGGGAPVLACGPCSVESEAQIRHIAETLRPLGVGLLRGGAFKPRTSPYSFQGHGAPALEWLSRAARDNGMVVVTEALSEADVELVAEHAELVQIGSRNMQNFALLKAVGRTGRPALLKRAMAATVEEWLLAGEYLLARARPGRWCSASAACAASTRRRATCSTSAPWRSSRTCTGCPCSSTRRTPRGDVTSCPALARAALAAGARA
jgi:3-deoxy-7-phosphoheptulonate synthase